MKKILFIASILITTFMTSAQTTNIYDYSFQDIEGNEVSLAQFKGKKILFINVASKCGYTDQYEEMQQLHDQYGDKVVLIGFPCNQFGLQAFGGERGIRTPGNFRFNGFQDRRIRPLCHLSGANIEGGTLPAKIFQPFCKKFSLNAFGIL